MPPRPRRCPPSQQSALRRVLFTLVLSVLCAVPAQALRWKWSDPLWTSTNRASGAAVAVKGNVIAAGAPGVGLGYNGDAGAVLVFTRNNGDRWDTSLRVPAPTSFSPFPQAVAARLQPGDLEGPARFGSAIAIGPNDRIVVGAPGAVITDLGFFGEGSLSLDTPAMDNPLYTGSLALNGHRFVREAGAVYVFEEGNGSKWGKVTKLTERTSLVGMTGSAPMFYDRFGTSVDTIGDFIAVGIPGEHYGTTAAIVDQVRSLAAIVSDPEVIEKFVKEQLGEADGGAQVWMKTEAGWRLVVHISPEQWGEGGSDQIYDPNSVSVIPGMWEGYPPSRFGACVRLSPDGNILFVGAPDFTDGGRGYFFIRDPNADLDVIGQWKNAHREKLVTDKGAGALFGTSAAWLDHRTIAIGAPGKSTVIIYRVNEDRTFTKLQEIGGGTGGGPAAMGSTLSASGDRLAIGTPNAMINGLNEPQEYWPESDFPLRSYSGSVGVYRRNPANPDQWVFESSLLHPASRNEGDRFGEAVAIDGSTLVGTAPGLGAALTNLLTVRISGQFEGVGGGLRGSGLQGEMLWIERDGKPIFRPHYPNYRLLYFGNPYSAADDNPGPPSQFSNSFSVDVDAFATYRIFIPSSLPLDFYSGSFQNLPTRASPDPAYGTRTVTTNGSDVTLVLGDPTPPKIIGRVKQGLYGQPGVPVQLQTADGAIVTAVTDAQGDYVLEPNTANTTGTIRIDPTYQLTRSFAPADGIPVTIGEFRSVQFVSTNFAEMTFSLGGVVRAGGTPLAGVTVSLAGHGRTAVTDAEGRYRFDSVYAGTYTVEIAPTSSVRYQGRLTGYRITNAHLTDANFEALYPIAGRFYLNGQPLAHREERDHEVFSYLNWRQAGRDYPISLPAAERANDPAFRLHVGLDGAPPVPTNPDGSFTVWAPVGARTLVAARSGWSFTEPEKTIQNRVGGVSQVAFHVARFTVSGRVVSGRGATVGVPGVGVRLIGNQGFTAILSTDARGYFRVENFPAGFTQVEIDEYLAEPPNFGPRTMPTFFYVVRDTALGDFFTRDHGGFSGIVSSEETGQPLAGVTVEQQMEHFTPQTGMIRQYDTINSTVTDAQGRYELLYHPSYRGPVLRQNPTFSRTGYHHLVARGPYFFSPYVHRVVPEYAVPANLGYTARRGQVTGTVVYQDQPLSGAQLLLDGVPVGTTGADGRFSFFSDLGERVLSVVHPTHAFTPTVFSPGANPTTLVLRGLNAAVGGTVRFRGAALPGIALQAADGTTTRSGADGTYSFVGLTGTNTTLTPSASTLHFTPASRTVTLGQTAVLGQDFTVEGFDLSGSLLAAGAGIGGETVRLRPIPRSTLTAQGNNEISVSGNLRRTRTTLPATPGFARNVRVSFQGLQLDINRKGGLFLVAPSGRREPLIANNTPDLITYSGTLDATTASGLARFDGERIDGIWWIESNGDFFSSTSCSLTLDVTDVPGPLDLSTTTGPGGAFTFTQLPRGAYHVELASNTYRAPAATVTITDAAVTGVNFQVEAPAWATEPSAPVTETGRRLLVGELNRPIEFTVTPANSGLPTSYQTTISVPPVVGGRLEQLTGTTFRFTPNLDFTGDVEFALRVMAGAMPGPEQAYTLRVPSPQLTAVETPPVLPGGQPSTVTLRLAQPIPAAGVTFRLSSDHPALAVPASVIHAGNATSATFVATVQPLSAPTRAHLTLTWPGGQRTVPVDLGRSQFNFAGVVRNAHGEPLAGAEVRFGDRTALSDAGGRYAFSDVDPSIPAPTATLYGYVARPAATLPEADNDSFDLVLDAEVLTPLDGRFLLPTGSENEFIALPNLDAWVSSSTGFTYSVWVRADAGTPSGAVLFETETATGDNAVRFTLQGESLTPTLIAGPGTAPNLISATRGLPVGEWAHLVLTFTPERGNPASGMVRLYLYGREIGSGTIARPAAVVRTVAEAARGLRGGLEEMTFWVRPLGWSEVQALTRQAASDEDPSLWARYSFNELRDTLLLDSGPSAQHATWQGAAEAPRGNATLGESRDLAPVRYDLTGVTTEGRRASAQLLTDYSWHGDFAPWSGGVDFTPRPAHVHHAFTDTFEFVVQAGGLVSPARTATVTAARYHVVVTSPASVVAGESVRFTVSLRDPAGPGGRSFPASHNAGGTTTTLRIDFAEGEQTKEFTLATASSATPTALWFRVEARWDETPTATTLITPNLATLGGRIVRQDTADDAAGYTIRLQGGGVDRTITTVEGGFYAFPGLPAGNYTVTASAPGTTLTGPNPRSVTLANVAVTDVNFTVQDAAPTSLTLTPSTVVAGVTTQAIVRLSSPAPLGGQRFTLSALTDGALALPSGSVLIPAGATEAGVLLGTAQTTQASTPLITATLGSGTVSAPLTITPTQQTIAGRLLRPGHDLGGITIRAAGSTGNFTTLTGPDGGYAFAGLLPGDYTLTVEAGGASFAPASRAVTLSLGGNVPQQDFTPLIPAWVGLTYSPQPAASGGTVTLTASVDAPAPPGGLLFILRSTMAGAPGRLLIPAGQSSASATFTYRYQREVATPVIHVNDFTGTNLLGSYVLTTTEPRRAIRGIVRLRDQPIDGVVVRLSQAVRLTDAGEPMAEVTTGADGTFAFPNLPPGRYHLAPSLAGHLITPSGQAFDLVDEDLTVPFTVVDPVLASFTATPADFRGATTVTVTATLASAAPRGGTTVTFASGNAAWLGVPASLTIPAGQATASFNVNVTEVSSRTLAVLRASVRGQELVAPVSAGPRLMIRGQATRDGAPLAGLALELLNQGSSTGRTATTDAQGNYVFADVPRGSYDVRPASSLGLPQPAVRHVVISDAPVDGLNFVVGSARVDYLRPWTTEPFLRSHGRFPVRVYLDQVVPPLAPPVTVQLSVDRTDARVPATVQVQPGFAYATFDVVAEQIDQPGELTVSATTGSITRSVSIPLQATPTTLSGRVFQFDGPPTLTASIRAEPASGGQALIGGVGADGSFSIGTTQRGVYFVSLVPSDGRWIAYPDRIRVDLSAGPVEGLRFDLAPSYPTRLELSPSTVRAGQPVTARIFLSAPSTTTAVPVSLRADQPEALALPASVTHGLHPAPYAEFTLPTVARDEAGIVRITAYVGPFETAAELTLTPATLEISGVMRDAAGQPVAGIPVALSGAATATASTDANGVYRFTGVTPGASYVVTPDESASIFAPAQRAVTLGELDHARGLDFVRYTEKRTASGFTRLSDGRPVAGVRVTIDGQSVLSAANGAWQIERIVPDVHPITVGALALAAPVDVPVVDVTDGDATGVEITLEPQVAALDLGRFARFGNINHGPLGYYSVTPLPHHALAGSFTLEGWLFLESSGTPQDFRLFSLRENSTSPISFGLRGAERRALLTIGRDGNTAQLVAPIGSEIPTGAWVHLAAVFEATDATSGVARLLINGRTVASGLLPRPTAVPSGSSTLGSAAPVGTWSAALDDLRIWSTARTAEEINARLLTWPANEPATGLVSRYSFDGDLIDEASGGLRYPLTYINVSGGAEFHDPRVNSTRASNPTATPYDAIPLRLAGATLIPAPVTYALNGEPAPAVGTVSALTGADFSFTRHPAFTGTARLYFTASAGEATSAAREIRLALGGRPVVSVSLAAATVSGLGQLTGTVTLAAVGDDPVRVQLVSDVPAAVFVPGEVIVPAGAASASFTLTGRNPATATTVAIIASANGGDAFTLVTATNDPNQPDASADGQLLALTLGQGSLTGFATTTGTLTFTSPLPAETVVTLSASTSTAVRMPASVVVPAGASNATFTLGANNPSANTAVTISATVADITRTAVVNLTRDATVRALSGRVVMGYGGPPIAGITVHAVDAFTGSFSATTLTDADGRFFFAVPAAMTLEVYPRLGNIIQPGVIVSASQTTVADLVWPESFVSQLVSVGGNSGDARTTFRARVYLDMPVPASTGLPIVLSAHPANAVALPTQVVVAQGQTSVEFEFQPRAITATTQLSLTASTVRDGVPQSSAVAYFNIQPARVQVSGRVLEDRLPKANQPLSLYSAQESLYATTDANGYFSFDAVVGQTYQLIPADFTRLLEQDPIAVGAAPITNLVRTVVTAPFIPDIEGRVLWTRSDAAPAAANVGPTVPNFMPGGAFTLEFWMRAESVNTPEAQLFEMVNRSGATPRDRLALGFAGTTGRLVAVTSNDAAGETSLAAPAEDAIPAGQWIHVALTVAQGDGRRGDAVLYLNGRAVASGEMAVPAAAAPRDTAYLAGNGESPIFRGLLDEVRLWTTARTGAEILAGARGRTATSLPSAADPALYFWYRFDGDTPTQLTDSSSGARHGVHRRPPTYVRTRTFALDPANPAAPISLHLAAAHAALLSPLTTVRVQDTAANVGTFSPIADDTLTFTRGVGFTGSLTVSYFARLSAAAGSSSGVQALTITGPAQRRLTGLTRERYGYPSGGTAAATLTVSPGDETLAVQLTANVASIAPQTITVPAGVTSLRVTWPIAADAPQAFADLTASTATESFTQGIMIVPGGAPPVLTQAPVAQTVRVGETAVFSLAYTATPAADVRWYRNNAQVGSGTTLTLSNVPLSFNGSQIRATVDNYFGAPIHTAPVTLTVLSAPLTQTITFTPPANVSFAAGQVTLEAVASSGLPVSFTLLSGPASLDGSTLTFTAPGAVVIRATQAGNGTTLAAEPVERTINVTKVAAQIQFSATTTVYNGTPQSPNITTIPAGLPVSVTYDGHPTAPTSAGDYAVEATIDDAIYGGSARTTFIIGRAAQTITFARPADRAFSTEPVELAASASSGLPVTFTRVEGLAELQRNRLVLQDGGRVTVRATQPGNADFLPAEPVEQSFDVAVDFATWSDALFDPAERNNPAIVGPNADPDGDGLSNLLEYALGLSPTHPGGLDALSAVAEQGAWAYRFERPAERGDLHFIVLSSTDLVEWRTHVPERVQAGDREIWQVSLPPDQTTQRYFRLQVSRP